MKRVNNPKFISLIFLAVIILLFILFIKTTHFNIDNPFYTFYSFAVTLFVGSRIIASLFYKTPKGSDPNYLPSVTFIIPVYDEESVIKETIKHCFEVDYPPDKIEVIVINDGSTDSTWRKVYSLKKYFPNLTAINLSHNQGKRLAMVEGIRKAKGEIIVQLDSDSYIEKNSLKPLVSCLEDRKIAGVSAHADPSNKDDNWLTKMQASYYFIAFRVQKAAESSLGIVFCCSGCCSAYRKEYVLPVLDRWVHETHFGVKTIYGDDRSLTNLLIRNGYNTVYCDKAQSYTIVPNTLKQFIKQQKRWKRSWVICTARTSLYIIKRDPFIAITYLFPQMIINYMAPILTIYSLLYLTISADRWPFIYLFGIFSLYIFYIVYYTAFRSDSYRPYILIWGGLNIFLCSIIFPYAILTLRDTRWGTR